MSYPWPGVREDIYIGGVTWVNNPETVDPRWLVAKSSERSRNATLHRDFLQPETGWPVVLKKLELTLGWPNMAPDDIRTVNGILSRDEILDVCTWVEISESFYFAAGAALAGTLKRRNALTAISPLQPAIVPARHAVTATRANGVALSVTLGTPDADGLTPWTAAGTSAGEYVTINYTPVYRMAPEDGQDSFPRGARQALTLVLVEV